MNEMNVKEAAEKWGREKGITVTADQQVEELQADFKTAQGMNAALKSDLEHCERVNTKLQAKNKQLKRALRKYGRCWSGCDSRAVLVESEGKGKGWYAADCTCGFDKALKGK